MSEYPTPWNVIPDDDNCRAVIRDADNLPVVFITDPIRPRALADAQMIADKVNENAKLKKQLAALRADVIPMGGDRFVRCADLQRPLDMLFALCKAMRGHVMTFEMLKKNAEQQADAIEGIVRQIKFQMDSGPLLFMEKDIERRVVEVKE